MKWFTDNNIRTNCTLVFSAGQAILAAKAGAKYVSPFIGRIDDSNWDGGGTYAIFPFNGAKIAVCPYGDMWGTKLSGNKFGMNFTGPTSMNDWLESLVLPDSWKEFNKQLNNEQWLDRVKKNIPKAFYKEMIKNPLILLNTLYEVLSPQNAGFKLLSIQQFAAAVLKSNECWVDSQVVAIRQDVYSDFLFAVANGDPPGVSTEEPVSLGK